MDPLGLAPIKTDADVAKASLAERITYVFTKLGDTYANELGDALKELVSPTAIVTTAAVFGIWAAAQATPAGWVADILIAGLGYVMLGKAVFDVLEAAIQTAMKVGSAKCLADLDSAAAALDRGLAAATVNAGLAAAGAAAPKMASLVRQLFKKKVPKIEPRRVFNGIELDPRLPPPVAGYEYSPKLVKGATTDNQAYSHWTGYQAEVNLVNEVVSLEQKVVKWGIRLAKMAAMSSL